MELDEKSVVRFFRTTTTELRALNNLAEQYLIFAEGQSVRCIVMTMQDWITKLDGFLNLNDREVLHNSTVKSRKQGVSFNNDIFTNLLG